MKGRSFENLLLFLLFRTSTENSSASVKLFLARSSKNHSFCLKAHFEGEIRFSWRCFLTTNAQKENIFQLFGRTFSKRLTKLPSSVRVGSFGEKSNFKVNINFLHFYFRSTEQKNFGCVSRKTRRRYQNYSRCNQRNPPWRKTFSILFGHFRISSQKLLASWQQCFRETFEFA